MLKRFKGEVTDRGAEACLPRNLSDDWLKVVQTGTDAMLLGEDDAGSTSAVAMAAVLKILETQRDGEILQVGFEEMHKLFSAFRIELALEEVHRKTEMKYEAATLSTIFSEREVRTWHDGER